MATDRHMHKELKDLPLESFPIWGQTLGYERGLPIFRQPPEYSEEGCLELIGQEYTYTRICRRMAPHVRASSRLSLTGHGELEDNSPPMALPPFQNEDEMCGSSYPVPWQQMPCAPAQSTSSQSYEQPSGEDSSYDADNPSNPLHSHPDVVHESPHYVYEYPVEPSAMEGIEGQTCPRAISTPNMDSTPSGSTSAPYNMQWQGHNGQMTSPQQDVQMADLFWFGSV